ncbi:hypothetical protein EUGRSUZ_G00583 [Eucalyptus grandis]|uniref:Uncharacterized protein n=2 Tax=Eucalyptus grandis TaxID=71139 RepID=A0ACC3K014_EUCGR|nr:hypothetical protein EUGRSUZ_G00583 [Eucalyptus grandis]
MLISSFFIPSSLFWLIFFFLIGEILLGGLANPSNKIGDFLRENVWWDNTITYRRVKAPSHSHFSKINNLC